MMRTPLLHPELLRVLAGAGHGAQILVADANYPASTARGPRAALVHLNLVPGTIDAVTVLQAICSSVPVEQARVMAPNTEGPYAMSGEPSLWAAFRETLRTAGAEDELEALERWAFYREASADDVALTVITGETRLYANILLRIGVVVPDDDEDDD